MTFSTHFITHKFPQIAKIAIVFKQQPFRNVTYEKFGRVETRPIHYIDAVVVEDDRNEKKTRISKEKKLLRHHLDHYLPKSLNPFFSLSFYNLIPSCYECNSPLKGDENKIQPYNPYTDDFDNDAVFSVEYAEEYKNSDINNISLKKEKSSMIEDDIDININVVGKSVVAVKYRKPFLIDRGKNYIRKVFAPRILNDFLCS